jgi:hypothetical protein
MIGSSPPFWCAAIRVRIITVATIFQQYKSAAQSADAAMKWRTSQKLLAWHAHC